MFVRYDDLTSASQSSPKWWFRGIPRFSDFHPDEVYVYAKEVALVHSICQACGKRYDVAEIGDLRAKLAYWNALEVGDPPNACEPPGCCGAHMQSEEIELLQFWERIGFEWRRVPELERRLVDFNGPAELWPPLSVHHRIRPAGLSEKWYKSQADGDIAGMYEVLTAVECEMPKDVIRMFEYERRYQAMSRSLREEIEALG